jgi:hypothetical protein
MRATRAALALLAALLPGFASAMDAEAVGSPVAARPTLRLVWMDAGASASLVYAGMAREVRSILSGIGVDLAWDKRPGGLLEEGEIGVILLDREPSRAGMRGHTMGCVIKEQRTRVLWVNLGTVARTAGVPQAVSHSWSVAERQRLAVALGRVVAHEVVHAIAPTLPHAPQGLLRAELTRPDLVARRLDLDRDTQAGFLRAIRLRGQPVARLDPIEGSRDR